MSFELSRLTLDESRSTGLPECLDQKALQAVHRGGSEVQRIAAVENGLRVPHVLHELRRTVLDALRSQNVFQLARLAIVQPGRSMIDDQIPPSTLNARPLTQAPSGPRRH